MLKAEEVVPNSIHFTSVATHDHVMLNKLKLSQGAFLAMDRAYIDYRVFEQFTQNGVFYVTKMKKNPRYRKLNGHIEMNFDGLAVLSDHQVLFEKDQVKHLSRCI